MLRRVSFLQWRCNCVLFSHYEAARNVTRCFAVLSRDTVFSVTTCYAATHGVTVYAVLAESYGLDGLFWNTRCCTVFSRTTSWYAVTRNLIGKLQP